ncbi:glycosyltransferase family 4 protein [Paenalcaligenes hominis]|uniref:glycosyltransferase family 4 protein n=1 Tax=Paenalcaligenes hominis TaxID=643674 RepID=UPI0035268E6B
MRVLLINFERGWRGGERQTLLTALGLSEQGLLPTVLARQGEPLAQRLAVLGIPVIECKSPRQALWYLLRQRDHYDIYHAQTSAALTWLASLKFLLKGKVVFTRRTAFPLRHEGKTETQYQQRIKKLRWKWSKVDEFVAISAAAAHDPQELGFKPIIIPSAVEFVPADTDHIIAFTEQHDLGGRYVLGTVAALTSEKDPETTIRAVHALWQQRQDFVFLHFGAEGDAAPAARALISELGLENVYKLMGFERRIEDMYRLMHVFVLSSRFEALGSSVLDAFLYAAPVVATQTGGLAELLADERGIACEVGDFNAIAAACDRILDDEPFRNQMILTALRWVQKEHGVDTMVQSYIDLYHGRLRAAPEPSTDLSAEPLDPPAVEPALESKPEPVLEPVLASEPVFTVSEVEESASKHT